MREFYFEDINKKIAFRGMFPDNDIDWKPLDYVIFPYIIQREHIYLDNYRHKNNLDTVDERTASLFRKKAVDEVLDFVGIVLHTHKCPDHIETLLKHDLLPKRQQEKLLKGLILNAKDVIYIMQKAEQLGYLLDIHSFEVYPERYKGKTPPACYHLKEDNTLDVIGKTDMTEGEMKALLKDRKLLMVRLFHKDEHWHCFYHTFRGLAGEEPGPHGSKPHWHYISDKYGIPKSELLERFKKGDAPSSKIHIEIERNVF